MDEESNEGRDARCARRMWLDGGLSAARNRETPS